MKNANVNIMDILNAFAAGSAAHQDTLAEFTKEVTKEELTEANKEQTNFKWMAVDGMLSIGNFVLNQYRQRQFENLQKNAEIDADAQLKEREQKLETLKKNLGISALEEHIKKQDEMMEEILKSIKHLNAVARRMEEEKENKKFKKETDDMAKKYLTEKPSIAKEMKAKIDDDDWT